MPNKTVRFCQTAAVIATVALLALLIADTVSAVTARDYMPPDLHQLVVAAVVFLAAISISIPMLRRAVHSQIRDGLAEHRATVRDELNQLVAITAEQLSQARMEGYGDGKEDGFRQGLLASVGQPPIEPAARRQHLRLTGSEDN